MTPETHPDKASKELFQKSATVTSEEQPSPQPTTSGTMLDVSKPGIYYHKNTLILYNCF